MTRKTKLHDLAQLKQSIWLDYLHRSLIDSGSLAFYVDRGLRGVTSNPSIFAKAISESEVYDPQLRHLALEGKSAVEIYE